MVKIADFRARRVWDSRGLPTIEIEVLSEGRKSGRAIAPAGASTGRREAPVLLDGGARLGGKDVTLALAAVTEVVAPALIGSNFDSMSQFDQALHKLSSAPGGPPVGANTTTAASLAMLQLLAAEKSVAAWQILGDIPATLPRPQIQIMGGGAHAAKRVAVQDFMVYPCTATNISDALVQIAEIYHAVGEILAKRAPLSGVADEGGHWPNVSNTEEALRLIVDGISNTGLVPGVDMGISLDIAANQFFQAGRYAVENHSYSSDEWVAELARLAHTFPIVSIEDPVQEDDDTGMVAAVAQCPSVIVGDDYLVTNATRIAAVPERSIDAVLIKVNQIGTVTGAKAAVDAARQRGLHIIVSARSGETEDTSVTHLATGWQADVLKVGSITRGERTAKWNELVRIDDYCGGLPLAPVIQKKFPPEISEP
jgi:enolase